MNFFPFGNQTSKRIVFSLQNLNKMTLVQNNMAAQSIEVTIESLSHDGRGIARVDGKAIFVDNALPGEKLLIELNRKKRNYAEAKKLSILTPAENRKTPPCEHFELCGGCSLQHMSDDLQLKIKQQTLIEQLKHFGGVESYELMPPITGPVWHYRRKARLSVRYVTKKKEVLVGFREKNGRFVADLKSCQVLHEKVSQLIPRLKKLITSLSCYDAVPQIEVAVGDDPITHIEVVALIMRHLKPLSQDDQEQLTDFACENNIYLYLQPKGINSIYKLWPNVENNYLSYCLSDYKQRLHFHPLDFIQVNAHINESMIKTALNMLALESNDRVLDLFCGLGNFTLPIAGQVSAVTGVEGSTDLVQRADYNANFNQISNAHFFVGDLYQSTEGHSVWKESDYDKILLDPPRSGAAQVIKDFQKFAAQKIVYVSCNPATLARDTALLVQQGYGLDQVGIIDMFPHTKHVEAIALFEAK